MQAADFPAIVQAFLDERQRPVTEQLRQLFAAYPTADHFLFEYLLGLDHAILAYARRANDTDLNEDKTLFTGFPDYLTELTAYDQQHGTALASELRGDERVAELLDSWFEDCWQAAGGVELPVPSYYMYEGDSSLFNLQTQEWQDGL